MVRILVSVIDECGRAVFYFAPRSSVAAADLAALKKLNGSVYALPVYAGGECDAEWAELEQRLRPHRVEEAEAHIRFANEPGELYSIFVQRQSN